MVKIVVQIAVEVEERGKRVLDVGREDGNSARSCLCGWGPVAGEGSEGRSRVGAGMGVGGLRGIRR